MEQWKAVPNRIGYEVSTHGRVRSIDRIVKTEKGERFYKGRVMRPGGCRTGHLTVVLGKGTTTLLVHYLVLLTFVGERPEGADILHGDGDPTNNRLDNLKYGSRSENILDVYHQGKAWRTLDKEKALAIKDRLQKGEKGRHLAKEFGVSESLVSGIKKGVFYSWLTSTSST